MGLFGMVTTTREVSPQRATEDLLRRIVGGFPMAAIEYESDRWFLRGELVANYRVSLHLWAEGYTVQMRVASGLWLTGEFNEGELLRLLLLENEACLEASFRLVESDGRWLVVLGRTVNSRTFPESQLVPLGRAMLERMQRLLVRLYAIDLIERGPDETTS